MEKNTMSEANLIDGQGNTPTRERDGNNIDRYSPFFFDRYAVDEGEEAKADDFRSCSTDLFAAIVADFEDSQDRYAVDEENEMSTSLLNTTILESIPECTSAESQDSDGVVENETRTSVSLNNPPQPTDCVSDPAIEGTNSGSRADDDGEEKGQTMSQEIIKPTCLAEKKDQISGDLEDGLLLASQEIRFVEDETANCQSLPNESRNVKAFTGVMLQEQTGDASHSEPNHVETVDDGAESSNRAFATPSKKTSEVEISESQEEPKNELSPKADKMYERIHDTATSPKPDEDVEGLQKDCVRPSISENFTTRERISEAASSEPYKEQKRLSTDTLQMSSDDEQSYSGSNDAASETQISGKFKIEEDTPTQHIQNAGDAQSVDESETIFVYDPANDISIHSVQYNHSAVEAEDFMQDLLIASVTQDNDPVISDTPSPDQSSFETPASPTIFASVRFMAEAENNLECSFESESDMSDLEDLDFAAMTSNFLSFLRVDEKENLSSEHGSNEKDKPNTQSFQDLVEKSNKCAIEKLEVVAEPQDSEHRCILTPRSDNIVGAADFDTTTPTKKTIEKDITDFGLNKPFMLISGTKSSQNEKQSPTINNANGSRENVERTNSQVDQGGEDQDLYGSSSTASNTVLAPGQALSHHLAYAVWRAKGMMQQVDKTNSPKQVEPVGNVSSQVLSLPPSKRKEEIAFNRARSPEAEKFARLLQRHKELSKKAEERSRDMSYRRASFGDVRNPEAGKFARLLQKHKEKEKEITMKSSITSRGLSPKRTSFHQVRSPESEKFAQLLQKHREKERGLTTETNEALHGFVPEGSFVQSPAAQNFCKLLQKHKEKEKRAHTKPDDESLGTSGKKLQLDSEAFSRLLTEWKTSSLDNGFEILPGGILSPLKGMSSPRTTTLEKDGDQTCPCQSALLSGDDDIIDFFLPRLCMGCTCGKKAKAFDKLRVFHSADPTSLENILRPWQVAFLKSVGIQQGDEYVKVHHKSAGQLAKAMRMWRKKHDMIPVQTTSCGMALHIWSRTCKVYIRSVRRQLKTGSEIVQPPNALEILSTFAKKVSLPSERSLSRRKSSKRVIEADSQVEV